MRVGVTVPHPSPAGAGEQDRRRHGLNLIAALQGLALVDHVHAVVAAGPDPLADPGADPMALTPAEALDRLDLLIEIAPLMTDEWLSCFRARGGRAVLHPCGTIHADIVTASIFARPAPTHGAGRHDAVWLMPDEAIYAPMLRALHRVPVQVVPALWTALADQRRYSPGLVSTHGARVAIVAPEPCALDMGAVAFLIADSAARQQPDAVVHAHLLRAADMVAQWSFACMVQSSDLAGRQGVAIDAASDPAAAFEQGANLLVTYHPAGGADFTCLDALAAGYPVVHNATALAGIGHAYGGEDIAAGAEVLLRAVRDHDAGFDRSQDEVAARLATRHPHHPVNRDAYARALLALRNTTRRAA